MGILVEEYSKIAVVILNWNGQSFLEKFLPKLVENSQSTDVRIYIADNGSTDSSVAFLQSEYPQLNLIQFSENYGFTGGYNKALKLINAEYFVVLNSDVEVTPDWITPIIEYMDKHNDVAACQPKIKSYSQKDYFEYAGAAGGFIDKYGYPFCRGRILNVYEKDNGQYNEISEIFWATGACMFIRSELFHLAGGFDEDFFAHMEEIDLCWRLKNLGYKIVYHPGSTIYHVGGGTLPNNNPQKLFLNYRNNLFLLAKNLPSKHFVLIFFLRMILDGASSLVYLMSFSFSFFIAVFRAHLHFYLSLKSLRIKRRSLAQQNNKYKHSQIYNGSIVKAFFYNKKRNFSDLNFKIEK